MTRALPNMSEIPTAEIVQEFEYLLHNSPDLEIRHKPCGTVFRNIDSVIIDGLLWMRSHHHECGNELVLTANATFVRVYQDGDGVTILEVTYNPARGPRETQTKSMRLYPKNYPKADRAQ